MLQDALETLVMGFAGGYLGHPSYVYAWPYASPFVVSFPIWGHTRPLAGAPHSQPDDNESA